MADTLSDDGTSKLNHYEEPTIPTIPTLPTIIDLLIRKIEVPTFEGTHEPIPAGEELEWMARFDGITPNPFMLSQYFDHVTNHFSNKGALLYFQNAINTDPALRVFNDDRQILTFINSVNGIILELYSAGLSEYQNYWWVIMYLLNNSKWTSIMQPPPGFDSEPTIMRITYLSKARAVIQISPHGSEENPYLTTLEMIDQLILELSNSIEDESVSFQLD
ncbi:hypothetical protein KC685_01920 [Candidatus Dojkabacteria bacterium]|uniref:Uncharacterized protein n=1 Tax=Candidatus Dojkabacteria bacterium TaxID=2099670 RepID=A0A955I2M4_9BACT|nr:hypothetical protein [Candidatus Dojkabacteria bacterium]